MDINIDIEYAGFWQRATAFLIDRIILIIAGIFLGLIFWGLIWVIWTIFEIGKPEPIAFEAGTKVASYIMGTILGWLYFTILESSANQATPGKRAMGIIVTDLYGDRISFARANGRYWGKIISAIILLAGFLMAAFTWRKQALHDLMASTLVVKKSAVNNFQ